MIFNGFCAGGAAMPIFTKEKNMTAIGVKKLCEVAQAILNLSYTDATILSEILAEEAVNATDKYQFADALVDTAIKILEKAGHEDE